ncbi:MAG: ATP-binding protein [archaeon]
MKEITILSGKGGTGKSTITASLSVLLSKDYDILSVDCDVDASNLAILLGDKEPLEKEEISTNEKAFLKNPDKCRGESCKKCVDLCTFSAIQWDQEKQKPEINKHLCEGCSACKIACPENVFELKKVKNAFITKIETDYEFPLISGQLKMGEAGSGKVVDLIKQKSREENKDIMISDSAAGISCPVIASVRDSDYVIAVTEPSPAALSDLKRALNIVEQFGISYGIIINRFDLNKKYSKEIEKFASNRGIKILGKIPYDRVFVESLIEMTPVVERSQKYRDLFKEILMRISEDSELF